MLVRENCAHVPRVTDTIQGLLLEGDESARILALNREGLQGLALLTPVVLGESQNTEIQVEHIVLPLERLVVSVRQDGEVVHGPRRVELCGLRQNNQTSRDEPGSDLLHLQVSRSLIQDPHAQDRQGERCLLAELVALLLPGYRGDVTIISLREESDLTIHVRA